MFLTQLRAILRAAAHGQVHLLIPMLAHASEIRQTFELIEKAREQLDKRAEVHGPVKVGAMIEVPAAAMSLPLFLKYFDFLSIGTNDLIQYTLAVDRNNDELAGLYDPLHPAVLRLLALVIATGHRAGRAVAMCGEMAGDTRYTALLLALGLTEFSMHPGHLLEVRETVNALDHGALRRLAPKLLRATHRERIAELVGSMRVEVTATPEPLESSLD